MRVGLKWFLLVGIGLLYLTKIGSGSPPGRKIRLRQYEIQFGKWPLMEITKLQKRPRSKWGALNGFMKNAIQANQFNQGLQTIQQYYGTPPSSTFGNNNGGPIVFVNNNNAGPPPPLKFANNNGGNLGPIQFVDTNNGRPSFINNNKGPVPFKFGNNNGGPPLQFGNSNIGPNQNQAPGFYVGLGPPFPMKAPQYKPKPVIIKGPPPLPLEGSLLSIPSGSDPKKTSLKSLISSVMGKAAYSGFFSQNGKYVNKYNPESSFPPGPPPGFGSPIINQNNQMNSFPAGNSPSAFGGPVIIKSRGPPPPLNSQQGFQSNMNFNFNQPPQVSLPVVVGDVASSSRFDMEKVPQVPPVIKIGHHAPEGYSMTHGEQQLITLKLPTSLANKRIDSEDLLAGAEYKFGDEIFSSLGKNNYRRQDGSVHISKKQEKKLPDIGAIYTVNMVLQTPNISAPMNGSQSEPFKQGMEEMHRIYGNNKQSPLDSQVKLLGKLFTELQRLKPSPVTVDSESSNTISARNNHYNSWDNERSNSNLKVERITKPKVDAPVIAVHIQTYSVPEPGSSDPDILDSARMFGLQGHRFEFGNTNEIINLIDTAQKADTSRIPLDELGNNRREVNHNLQEWIKAYVSLTRRINHEAHAKGESIANTSFRQHQIYMPSNTNFNSFSGSTAGFTQPQPLQPMDPKVFSQGASITNAGAVATYRG